MKKFWIKLISHILYFHDKTKRAEFRSRYNESSVYIRKMRKKGLSIGFGTYLSAGVEIRSKRTVIGKYCSIARGVTIGTGRHPLDALTTNSMAHRECYTETGPIGIKPEHRVSFEQSLPVKIGSDVWIGLNAVIMDGVTVGNGAVIGTNAVVTKDVPPYAIVVGIPARVLRYRFDSDTIARLEKLRWFDRDLEFIQNLPMGDIAQCLQILESTASEN